MMRDAFATALVKAAQQDERLLLLTGDHGYALFDEFRRTCPEQYINAGVAEQNMIGVAAGLCKGGFRPVVYGLSAFMPMRVLEQIKLDICYESLPVVLIGDGAGVVYSTLGASHQCNEDVAALRALPHLGILSPSDRWEMTACMALAFQATGPTYVRMGKADLGDVHEGPPSLQWGQLQPVRSGQATIALIATGSMVKTALVLTERWPDLSVWSAPSLKPLAVESVVAVCRQHQGLVVLEEHSIYGGLGSAIAEIAAAHAPIWVERIGIDDRFSETCGNYAHLLAEHRLDFVSIAARVQSFRQRIAP